MVKRVVLVFSLAMLLTTCLTFGTAHVASAHSTTSTHAHTANSCDVALSETTMDAKGSDSANVSATIWWDTCTVTYYASANSFSNGNGFAFHGEIMLVDATTGSYVDNTCNYAGVCNTPELSLDAGDDYYMVYDNNNGIFYSATNAWAWGPHYIEGQEY